MREAAKQVVLHSIKEQATGIINSGLLISAWGSPKKLYQVETLTGLKDGLEQRRVCGLSNGSFLLYGFWVSAGDGKGKSVLLRNYLEKAL